MNPPQARPSTARFLTLHLLRCALAASTLLFSACSMLIVHPKPSANAIQRSGQVKFASSTENIVGDIVIRYDENSFLAEITKGPGVTLLTVSAEFGTDPADEQLKQRHMRIVRASGPLSHGGWIWRPTRLTANNYSAKKLKEPSRAWGALPEVFMWADANATRKEFRVCYPDIIMHTRTGGGEVVRFDYAHHQNPTEGDLTMAELKRQPVLEKVICHLDR